MQNKYRDRGLVVLGVHAWSDREGKADVEAFRKKFTINYPLLLNGRVTADAYGVRSVPANFWLDPSGKIVDSTVGFSPSDHAAMEKRIEKLLQSHTNP